MPIRPCLVVGMRVKADAGFTSGVGTIVEIRPPYDHLTPDDRFYNDPLVNVREDPGSKFTIRGWYASWCTPIFD